MGISFGEKLPDKFCPFRENGISACGMLIMPWEKVCPKHVGKKEKKRNPQKKFRGRSKTWDGFQGAVE